MKRLTGYLAEIKNIPRRCQGLVVCLALATPACAAGGCQQIGFLAYLFAPPQPTKEIDAEFDGLKQKTVAVVVYASLNTQYEHPEAMLELTDSMAVELRKNVEDVTVIDARRVVRYQEENPRWDQMPPGQLCHVFNTDYVLLISLVEFETRESGLGDMLRGRITAEALLYDRPEDDLNVNAKPIWHTEAPIRIVYPQESPLGLGGNNEMAVRVKTEELFVDRLAKKFYKHKAPVEP